MATLIPTLLLLSFLLTSCASTSGEDDGTVHHIVLCWLKEPENEEARRAVIDGSKRLEDIPGVIHVEAGGPVPSDRAIVEDSFDVGIVIVLRDRAALAAYATNPMHLAILKEVLLPVTERYQVIDIEVE